MDNDYRKQVCTLMIWENKKYGFIREDGNPPGKPRSEYQAGRVDRATGRG